MILSDKDFLVAQRVFNNIKRKRWDTANKLVKKSKNSLISIIKFFPKIQHFEEIL